MAQRTQSQTQPQGIFSSYAPRLRTYQNALITPVLPSSVPANLLSRTTKRGTTIINYAEDGYDDIDDDEDEGRSKRPTGLRSLRREDIVNKVDPSEKVGKETNEPVEVQGIWRDWMGKARAARNDAQSYAQASLPLTLIPIRIDLEIPSFVPQPPIPVPTYGHLNSDNPLSKPQDATLPYRLRDVFLWNLHETLITTDQFALTIVQDLDLPNRQATVAEISKQIRTQLEEYAGVALHPLFHSKPAQTSAPDPAKLTRTDSSTPAPIAASIGRTDTPTRTPAALPATPAPAASSVQTKNGEVTAAATPIPPDGDEDVSPDDTYRCIVNLNINLGSSVYTDKFEWSLLHPPGTAEVFAKQTCADLGLYGEWIPAMTHAIYEAVLRLKKEACEVGGLVAGWAAGTGGTEYPNDAAQTAEGAGAGWRYEPEHLADDWAPKLEFLSKEDIEKREGDRERQLRRLRRETARFSSNTGMAGGVPAGLSLGPPLDQEEERMGRGERSKKKRRFRSLSPLARMGTPGGRGTPDVGGQSYGSAIGYGGVGALADQERTSWRCVHCRVWGTSVWAVRDGPAGPRTLCNNCGFLFERDRKLPRATRHLHYNDQKPV